MLVNLDLFVTFGLYLSILAIIFLYLSYNVISVRGHKRITLGDKNDPVLLRARRAHANFAEYVPFAVIMILVISQITAPITFGKIEPMSITAHSLFLLLILGRLCHAYGMLKQEVGAKPSYRMRQAGVVLTFGVIGLSTLVLTLNWIYSLALQANLSTQV